ncbi:MAG TPA: tyrosine-type recombinase/integrase [Gaiellaceae bacterium]
MARGRNIRRRGNSWIAYLRVDGVQRQRSFKDRDYGGSKGAREEAELFLARERQKKREGQASEFDRTAIAKRRTTLREFAEEKWLPFAKARVRVRTFESYESHVRVHLLPALGDYQLGAITPELLDEFFSDWSAAGAMFQERVELARRLEEERWQRAFEDARTAERVLAAREGRTPHALDVPRRRIRLGTSSGTLQNALTALRAMLACAVRWGYIAGNPAAGLSLPKGEAQEMQPLNREQVDALLGKLTSPARVAVMTAVSTGVRRGELFALRWSDFDRKRRRLWIRRSLNRHLQFEEPKTKRSVRTIACRPTLVEALVAHRLESDFSGDDDLIFPNANGDPMDAANFVRREFRPALRRAGVPLVRFHDLRHTFASLLIAQGLAPKLISEQLGHASIAITMDRYGHLFDQSYADASDAIEQAFELPSVEDAVAAASGPPASTVPAVPAPAAAAQPAAIIRLE